MAPQPERNAYFSYHDLHLSNRGQGPRSVWIVVAEVAAAAASPFTWVMMASTTSTTPTPPAGSVPEPTTDQSLLRRCREGCEDAARDLYMRYASRLRALAVAQCADDLKTRFDADDIVQSVFRTFFEGLRESSYELPEGQELWGLLFVMALHKIRNRANYHRAAKRDVGQTVGSPGLEGEHFASDEASMAFLLMLIEDELKGDPPANQQIVRMRIEGYDIGEIVERTGRSRRTIERVLQDFRRRLSDPC